MRLYIGRPVMRVEGGEMGRKWCKIGQEEHFRTNTIIMKVASTGFYVVSVG